MEGRGAVPRPMGSARGCPWSRDDARGARIGLDRHAQRARERLEDRLALVVRVVAAQVVDVHRHVRVVHEALEELAHQVDVELADPGAREVDVELEPGPAREVDHRARQRLVERHVGVPVAADALLVAERLRHRLPERDADVLDRVVGVDLEVALRLHREVDHAVARDLVEHVVEERDARGEARLARAVEVHGDEDLGFLGVSLDFRGAHGVSRRLGKCREESRVLVGRADGEPQAVRRAGDGSRGGS